MANSELMVIYPLVNMQQAVVYPLVICHSLLLKPWPSRNSGWLPTENGWIFHSYVNVYQRVLYCWYCWLLIENIKSTYIILISDCFHCFRTSPSCSKSPQISPICTVSPLVSMMAQVHPAKRSKLPMSPGTGSQKKNWPYSQSSPETNPMCWEQCGSETPRWIWLVVSPPSEKYESQLGWFFPIYGKIKNVPSHQPVRRIE